MRRGIKVEDDAVKRNMDAHHNLLFGCNGKKESESDDEMGHIVLGDYRIDQHLPEPPKPSQLGKILLGAGLLATGIGGPLGAWFVADAIRNKPAPAPVEQVQPETKTETKVIDWTVGEPIVE